MQQRGGTSRKRTRLNWRKQPIELETKYEEVSFTRHPYLISSSKTQAKEWKTSGLEA